MSDNRRSVLTLDDIGWANARIEELEAKLEGANERAFKEGLRYSINVKICDEHDVQTAWDWSKLKQENPPNN